MTCEEALILLSGHLDGTNTAEEAAQLQVHLETCSACRQLLTAFEEADAGLRGLEVDPPADLRDAIMSEIRREKPAKKKKSSVWAGLAAAAALALLVGAGSFEAPLTSQEETAFPAAVRSVAELASVESGTGPVTRTLITPVSVEALAEERGAEIAVTYDLLPEMEVCTCETLADGSLLYCLEDPDGAAQLSRAYGLELVAPEAGSVSDVSYALLAIAE